jgi:hypothetical protein
LAVTPVEFIVDRSAVTGGRVIDDNGDHFIFTREQLFDGEFVGLFEGFLQRAQEAA